MDEFRTELQIKPSETKISLRQPVLTIGSCFADSIGLKLQTSKFSVSINPFGTVYNPISIHKLILQTINKQPFAENSYLQNDDTILNYNFHSEFNSTSKQELEKNINHAIDQGHHFLRSAHSIIITYGTAWVYERSDTNEVVANCHKIPSSLFKKNILTQKKIVESFGEMYRAVKIYNPEIRIILTVSPVRHLKDTLELNSVSKSILRLSCHTLTEVYNDVDYFPAYEILLDDLRDYRFYSSDLIHPTDFAIDYIWVKFYETYFSSETKIFLQEWQMILKALEHRPFQPTSTAHQKFLKETLKKLYVLKTSVNVDTEIISVESQLI